MKKIWLIIFGIFLFPSSLVLSQTSIASDDFENSSIFTIVNGAYFSGNSAAGDRPASSAFPAVNTYAYGGTNTTVTLTSPTFNTSTYTAISCSLRVASWSIASTGNGADATDLVRVEISPDGGTTYYNTAEILGNSNAYWHYSTGTGSASTAYDGNVTPVQFQPAAGGARTTDGYSTLIVSGLPAINNLMIRITLLNNSTNERWTIDDFNLYGTIASCTTPAEPTIQPSASSASSVNCTSFTLNWTNTGDGTNRLVVLKDGSAPTAPSDLTSYTANTTFGSGTSTDGGSSFVVYGGTGNTVTITGLTTNHTYYWAIYEYNGSGACDNFFTTGPASGNVITMMAEPTTQASASSASSIACTSFTLGWTSGNGSNRLVVLRDGSAPTAPSDLTSYTANTVFGSGTSTDAGSSFVLYGGTSNTVSITGLTNGHTYYWAIYEFNGSGGCQNYLTSSTSSGNVTVTTSEPTTQTSSSVGTATCSTSSMDINWTSGNGSSRIVVLQDGSAPTAPTDYTVYSASSTFGSGTAIGSGFVVYNFTGTSVHITNLTAGHTYYWAIYEYNGSMTGGCANFLTTSPASGNVTPGNTEPTSPSTASSSSSVTCNAFTINLTKGNGANRLIVVKAGSAPTAPTDYTSYTANTTFGSGSTTAAGSYVVYNGTATGAGVVTVTGLTNNTTYYWAIYEFNGSGSCANFLTSSSESGSVLVATTEPTIQASASSASSIGCTSFTLGWTNGNGSNRLVVLKDGSAPTAPTDLNSYTANSAFGSGNTTAAGSYVVYNGTGNSVSITALTSTHTYYWAVYEFNGTGTCINYFTSSSTSGNATTPSSDPEPTVQVNPSASSNIGCNSFLLSWTSGNGTSRLVVIKSGSSVSAPSDGTSYTANSSFGSGTALGGGNVVYAGSGSSVFITNLSASTTYYWGVYEYNGSGTCVNYLTSSVASGSVTTTACSSPIGVTGIYIDACPGTCGYEGNNEMVWGTTGSYGMSVSNSGPALYYDAVTPPTTTYISTYSQYASKVTALNTAVSSCGTTTFVDPNTQGYIPANSRFLIAHSCLCDPLAYDLSNLCGSGPIYVVFGDNAAWPCGSGSGIFGNSSACNGNTRYIKVDFNAWGINSAPIYNYDPCSESGNDGDYGLFDPAGGAITTYGSNPSCQVPLIILPIELVKFTAFLSNDKINIEWKTASEKNLQNYAVEKSYDAINFFTLENVHPSNIETGSEYFATDFSPSPALNYYRLKISEYDGTVNYSGIVSVSVGKSKAAQVYQYGEELFINTPLGLHDEASLQITDLAGKTIFQKKLNSKNEIINASALNLSGGIYFATIIKNNSILITQKIVVP